MPKFRCKKCNRWLFSGEGKMKIKIKCPKCKYINKIEN